MKHAPKYSRGHTFTEMVIVIAILAVVAAIAIPDLSSNEETTLDLAAAEVAGAVRFAQSEAIRTGIAHGVYATQGGQRIRIYSLPGIFPVYDVYDPLTKQLYDLNFGAGTSDVAIESVYFKFEGSPIPREFLGFSGGTGLPKTNDFGTIRMLETAYIELSHDSVQWTINISPMTGRVTVQ